MHSLMTSEVRVNRLRIASLIWLAIGIIGCTVFGFYAVTQDDGKAAAILLGLAAFGAVAWILIARAKRPSSS